MKVFRWLPHRLFSLIQFIFMLWIAMFVATYDFDAQTQTGSGYDDGLISICDCNTASMLVANEGSGAPTGSSRHISPGVRFVASNNVSNLGNEIGALKAAAQGNLPLPEL